jgi:hypothetical protein
MLVDTRGCMLARTDAPCVSLAPTEVQITEPETQTHGDSKRGARQGEGGESPEE